MKYKYSCFRLEKHINHNRFSGLLNAVEIFLFNLLSFHTKKHTRFLAHNTFFHCKHARVNDTYINLSISAFQCHRNASLFKLNIFLQMLLFSLESNTRWAVSLSCFNHPVFRREILFNVVIVVDTSETLSLTHTVNGINFAAVIGR